MNTFRDRYLHAATARSTDRLCHVVAGLTGDTHADREALLAEVEFQRWFIDSCQDTSNTRD